MIDEPTLAALGSPLDPALVDTRRAGNGQVRYVKGHNAIDQANRLFGYDGWGYEIVGEIKFLSVDKADKNSGEIRTTHGYYAMVRVDVDGVAFGRVDVGFTTVADNTADGHDTAIKGAVTDGLKRALRSFGPQFGNDLYAKPQQQQSRPQQQRQQQQSRPQQQGAQGQQQQARQPQRQQAQQPQQQQQQGGQQQPTQAASAAPPEASQQREVATTPRSDQAKAFTDQYKKWRELDRPQLAEQVLKAASGQGLEWHEHEEHFMEVGK